MKVQRVFYHVQCLMGVAMHTWICCSGWSLFVVAFFCYYSSSNPGHVIDPFVHMELLLLIFFSLQKKRAVACLLLLCYSPLHAKRNILLMFSYRFKMLLCKKNKNATRQDVKKCLLSFLMIEKQDEHGSFAKKKFACVRDGGNSLQASRASLHWII